MHYFYIYFKSIMLNVKFIEVKIFEMKLNKILLLILTVCQFTLFLHVSLKLRKFIIIFIFFNLLF